MNSILVRLYKIFKIEELRNFFRFLIHQYNPKQFNPLVVRDNLRVIFQLKDHQEELIADKEGKLRIEKANKIALKNALTLGALNNRTEKIIFYTLLTMTLETFNPLNLATLKVYTERKKALIDRLLKHLETVRGQRWWSDLVREHAQIFLAKSLLQERIVKQMQLAVRRQKKIPLVQDGQEALDRGLYPLLITQGASGAYWIRGTNREVIGLFKPFDEEIHAPNNPIGPIMRGALGQRRTRRGCRVGEAAHHEVGAFLVDSFFGFGIVPRTYYAAFTHKAFSLASEDRLSSRRSIKTKLGSFQEFIEGFVPFTSELALKNPQSIPLEEFQLLMILDLIIGNTDRNSGNILVGDEKIAAIDHGLAFPDALDLLSYWYWSFLEQGKQPLFPSLIELIEHFPFDELGRKLQHHCFISPSSLNRMRERIVLFREAIHAGLLPYQVEKLMVEEYLAPLLDLKSTLEEKAREQVILFQTKNAEEVD